ncbi:MAG: right-handed parallel beta-helix repeat-containing protein, partial [Promethearchaeia archaeon]
MNQKLKNQIFLISLFILFNVFNISMTNLDENPINKDDQEIINEPFRTIEKSGTYGIILITGANWSDAIAKGICTGSGTFTDPYVIKNHLFDGGPPSEYLSTFTIKDSDAYFRIKNCTFINSWPGSGEGGLELDNVSNGMIINNTMRNNGFGLLLNGASHNNTFLKNKIYNNKGGIGVNYQCENNTFIDNKIYNNSFVGLNIRGKGNYFYKNFINNSIA